MAKKKRKKPQPQLTPSIYPQPHSLPPISKPIPKPDLPTTDETPPDWMGFPGLPVFRAGWLGGVLWDEAAGRGRRSFLCH